MKPNQFLGYTQSGKRVYSNFDNPLHGSFISQDYADVCSYLANKCDKFQRKVGRSIDNSKELKEEYDYYNRQFDLYFTKRNQMLKEENYVDPLGRGCHREICFMTKKLKTLELFNALKKSINFIENLADADEDNSQTFHLLCDLKRTRDKMCK